MRLLVCEVLRLPELIIPVRAVCCEMALAKLALAVVPDMADKAPLPLATAIKLLPPALPALFRLLGFVAEPDAETAEAEDDPRAEMDPGFTDQFKASPGLPEATDNVGELNDESEDDCILKDEAEDGDERLMLDSVRLLLCADIGDVGTFVFGLIACFAAAPTRLADALATTAPLLSTTLKS